MTLELSQEQQILQETVREFSQTEILPLASKIDLDCLVPKELTSKLPNIGLFGISVPSEFGGAGGDFLSLVIACEEVSRVSGSLGAQISFHNAVVCEALIASANTTLKAELLQSLASGTLGAFDFSSDTLRNHLTCKIKGNELVVNGASDYVTSAADAGVFLFAANLSEEGKRA
ncbi:MAG TPA: acyl-CoA dehydrogenase family protein, partial [Nitrososphaerales archaeon]|nr:acyl-CoA dehydrogenase family protein [Nitrososphaerales archaeon]